MGKYQTENELQDKTTKSYRNNSLNAKESDIERTSSPFPISRSQKKTLRENYRGRKSSKVKFREERTRRLTLQTPEVQVRVLDSCLPHSAGNFMRQKEFLKPKFSHCS
mmetsp:Transcript_9415/g.10309  ORF Transcript_9415/g.10309 Transcript_9415/m.10309 type:complete len:108 (-) Transcript_9415:290-613(-)